MRVTVKMLEARIHYLNKLTNSPWKPYEWCSIEGKYKGQIGNYHLDGAYGGYKLARMCSEGGSITNVLNCGYETKRDLLKLIEAFQRGIEETQAA